jgi:transcription-repair coupling factor (superfamily II helicase)
VREVSVVREVARISPIRLAASKEIRLKRLFPKAIYKAEPRQLQLPVKTDRAMVLAIRDFLADMLPDGEDVGK